MKTSEKGKKKKQQRANYIKMRCNAVINRATEVKRIADELFISEATVWRDLGR